MANITQQLREQFSVGDEILVQRKHGEHPGRILQTHGSRATVKCDKSTEVIPYKRLRHPDQPKSDVGSRSAATVKVEALVPLHVPVERQAPAVDGSKNAVPVEARNDVTTFLEMGGALETDLIARREEFLMEARELEMEALRLSDISKVKAANANSLAPQIDILRQLRELASKVLP